MESFRQHLPYITSGDVEFSVGYTYLYEAWATVPLAHSMSCPAIDATGIWLISPLPTAKTTSESPAYESDRSLLRPKEIVDQGAVTLLRLSISELGPPARFKCNMNRHMRIVERLGARSTCQKSNNQGKCSHTNGFKKGFVFPKTARDGCSKAHERAFYDSNSELLWLTMLYIRS